MKKFEKYVDLSFDLPINTKNLMFLDIETDGLSHKNKIAIIGLLILKPGLEKALSIQLFNDDYHSEKIILTELVEQIEEHRVDYYISFNGNAFDFPFINARLAHYKIQSRLNKALNIDLLQIVRKNKHLFPIEKFTLKSIERFLGINREDTISGKDSVILYNAYLETKEPQLMDIICLHNYEDVLNMVPLMKIFDFLPDRGMHYIYPTVQVNHFTWHIIHYTFQKDFLEASLSTHFFSSGHMDVFVEKTGFTVAVNDDTAHVKLQIKHINEPKVGDIYFLDSEGIYGKSLPELTSEEKNDMVLAYNGEPYAGRIIEHIFNVFKSVLLDE